jgi:tRNA A37 threonylcarbamoyladenosine dehydratase
MPCSNFWIGGVGSFALEALVRAGIGTITLLTVTL